MWPPYLSDLSERHPASVANSSRDEHFQDARTRKLAWWASHPAFEGAVFGRQRQHARSVLDDRVYFEPGPIVPAVSGPGGHVEVVVGAAEVHGFLEDGDPGKTGPVDLQDGPLGERIVIGQGEAVPGILIDLVVAV